MCVVAGILGAVRGPDRAPTTPQDAGLASITVIQRTLLENVATSGRLPFIAVHSHHYRKDKIISSAIRVSVFKHSFEV